MTVYCTEAEKDTYSDDYYWNRLPSHVPSVTFHTRVQKGEEFQWQDISTWDLFAGKRVLVFSLPGAFTPTCSTYQLPQFEEMADDFYAEYFDEIYCVTVNDAFVCNAWAKANNLECVTVIPDGSGKFTEGMTMSVNKDNLGFGRRSWRYACVVENGEILDWFIEEGKDNDGKTDPYLFTSPSYIYKTLFGEQA